MKRSHRAALALGLSVTLAGCTSTSAEGGGSGDVLVVAGYAAEYQALFEKNIARPFTEKTGIRIRFTAGGSATESYTTNQTSNGDPGVDGAVMTSLELY